MSVLPRTIRSSANLQFIPSKSKTPNKAIKISPYCKENLIGLHRHHVCIEVSVNVFFLSLR